MELISAQNISAKDHEDLQWSSPNPTALTFVENPYENPDRIHRPSCSFRAGSG